MCLFDVYSRWLCLRSDDLLNCTSSLLTNNRVRPLVDCLCKDSCEVVTADESHPIVVCFCLQKRRCKKLHVSSVFQNSPRILKHSSLEVVFWGETYLQCDIHKITRSTEAAFHGDKTVAEIQRLYLNWCGEQAQTDSAFLHCCSAVCFVAMILV